MTSELLDDWSTRLPELQQKLSSVAAVLEPNRKNWRKNVQPAAGSLSKTIIRRAAPTRQCNSHCRKGVAVQGRPAKLLRVMTLPGFRIRSMALAH
jgi:hypothetical protein